MFGPTLAGGFDRTNYANRAKLQLKRWTVGLGQAGCDSRSQDMTNNPDEASANLNRSGRDKSSLAFRLKAFGVPDSKRAWRELLITAGGFAVLWLGMWLSLDYGYWLTLLLAIPAAGFLVRLFVIQHDCGHGSFFGSRLANDLAGRTLGVLTWTPYDDWRRAHSVHHSTSGNLDRRGIGDIHVLTLREYRELPGSRRLAYRCFRNPGVLFGIGPTILFVFLFRLPNTPPRGRKRMWGSVLATNLAIAGLVTCMALAVGPIVLLKIHLPLIVIASSIGTWLFFVQHQFEDVYWRREKAWNFHEAALFGSSNYQLPKILQWITGNIGLHHVHHLCSRIPSYRLQECVERFPELRQVKPMAMRDSLRCAALSLWDEDAGKMIRFRDLNDGIATG